MFDPEVFVLKSGTVLIVALAVVRIVLHDVYNITSEFRRWRKRQ